MRVSFYCPIFEGDPSRKLVVKMKHFNWTSVLLSNNNINDDENKNIYVCTFTRLRHLDHISPPALCNTSQRLCLPCCQGISSLSEIMGKPATPSSSLTPYSTVVTTSKYCSVIWVRKRKTRSTQVS